MDEKEESVHHLKLGLEKGYRNFGHLATDDDLVNVRNLPAFKALIKKWEQIHEATLPKENGPEENVDDYRQPVC